MKFKAVIYLVSCFLFFINCSKDKVSNEQNEEEQTEETILLSEFTAQIIEEGDAIIDQVIVDAVANNSNIDLALIKSQIEKLEGVERVEISPKASAVIVYEKSGTVLNLLLFKKNDSRILYQNESGKSSKINSTKFPPVVASSGSGTALGRALILAPFQNEFDENLAGIAARFTEAKYRTDIFTNESADLSKFKGDFLTQYDIVFISTHGNDLNGVNNTNQKGKSVSLSTGQKATTPFYDSLTMAEKQATTIMGGNFGITPEWITNSASGSFTNTWVFISACHSASSYQGSSFTDAFSELNAAAYNGYSDFIYVDLGTAIADRVTGTFSSGKSFEEMYEIVQNDIGLITGAAQIRTNENNLPQFANVGLLTSTKFIADPFYLILPDDTIGTATLNPNSGPEDTEVVYTVEIKAPFIDLVDSITFEIDNTNQSGLVMEKTSDSTWEYTDLTAPDGKFPRIDTFAFTAFNSEGEALGSGSAGFSFTQSSGGKSGKSGKKSNQTWTK